MALCRLFHLPDRKPLRMGHLRGKILNFCYIYEGMCFFMTQVMLQNLTARQRQAYVLRFDRKN